MARPRKRGIEYFPFDVDFFSDKKIRILKSRFGADGIAIYLYLLCEVYKNGYFIQIDDDYEYIISDDLSMSNEKVKQVLKFLLERSLLDSKLFQSDTIITSRGIQCRFQEAIKTRASKSEIEVESKYWLLSESETQPFIKFTQNEDYSEKNPSYSEKNPSYSEKNPSYSEKNDTKESKEKESKENKSNTRSELNESAPSSNLKIPLNDNSFYEVPIKRLAEWKKAFPSVDVEYQLNRMIVWCNANPKKRKTKRGVERFITNWLGKEQDSGGGYQSFKDSAKENFYKKTELQYDQQPLINLWDEE